MNVNNTDADGNSVASYLKTIDDSTSEIKGHVKISKVGDNSKYAIFTITRNRTQVGYEEVTVTLLNSNNTAPFTNGDDCILTFARTGDSGDKGQKDKKDKRVK